MQLTLQEEQIYEECGLILENFYLSKNLDTELNEWQNSSNL